MVGGGVSGYLEENVKFVGVGTHYRHQTKQILSMLYDQHDSSRALYLSSFLFAHHRIRVNIF